MQGYSLARAGQPAVAGVFDTITPKIETEAAKLKAYGNRGLTVAPNRVKNPYNKTSNFSILVTTGLSHLGSIQLVPIVQLTRLPPARSTAHVGYIYSASVVRIGHTRLI
jgi:hypothetical protein